MLSSPKKSNSGKYVRVPIKFPGAVISVPLAFNIPLVGKDAIVYVKEELAMFNGTIAKPLFLFAK